MWQKARVLRGDDDMVGLTLWVRAEPPKAQRSRELTMNGVTISHTVIRGIESNIRNPLDGTLGFVDIGEIELLGEFTEIAPFVTVDEFLRGES